MFEMRPKMTALLHKIAVAASLMLAVTVDLPAQNPLLIPPLLTGDTIDLEIQSGTRIFYPPLATPTYGINGTWMAPTIVVQQGDTVLLRVTNHINTSTTIHWHGLHVAPEHDGGPHQLIPVNSTWSPRFAIMNNAGTFWYHPHGASKTDLHVSKGIAGFFLIQDTVEAALDLPRTYGVDDFPIVVQSKDFDVLKQIAISTPTDTAIFVNGTLDPVLAAPAQVVRLRLLNGSSNRSYLFGFGGDLPFALIATDGGLRASALQRTRIRLSPGERAEILIDLSGLQGQTVTLRNFGSELPHGIYGAATVGTGQATIPDYGLNPLNGADYDILPIEVGPPTSNPVTTWPTQLVALPAMDTSGLDAHQTLLLEPMLPSDSTTLAEGPFGINGVQFEMDSINLTTYLGNKELWRLRNTTLVAHPFHVHDVQFQVASVNGSPTPDYLQGLKDLVLVMPGEYVDIVTRFEDFADDMVPYMYHCHLLHHEDEGMMGSFLVLDTATVGQSDPVTATISLQAYPNPSTDTWTIVGDGQERMVSATLTNALGQRVRTVDLAGQMGSFSLLVRGDDLPSGVYFLRVVGSRSAGLLRLVKE